MPDTQQFQPPQDAPTTNPLEDAFREIAQLSNYVRRQTNPYTGAPLPQPTVGQGSYEVPQVPPPPGQVNRAAAS